MNASVHISLCCGDNDVVWVISTGELTIRRRGKKENTLTNDVSWKCDVVDSRSASWWSCKRENFGSCFFSLFFFVRFDNFFSSSVYIVNDVNFVHEKWTTVELGSMRQKRLSHTSFLEFVWYLACVCTVVSVFCPVVDLCDAVEFKKSQHSKRNGHASCIQAQIIANGTAQK